MVEAVARRHLGTQRLDQLAELLGTRVLDRECLLLAVDESIAGVELLRDPLHLFGDRSVQYVAPDGIEAEVGLAILAGMALLLDVVRVDEGGAVEVIVDHAPTVVQVEHVEHGQRVGCVGQVVELADLGATRTVGIDARATAEHAAVVVVVVLVVPRGVVLPALRVGETAILVGIELSDQGGVLVHRLAKQRVRIDRSTGLRVEGVVVLPGHLLEAALHLPSLAAGGNVCAAGHDLELRERRDILNASLLRGFLYFLGLSELGSSLLLL